MCNQQYGRSRKDKQARPKKRRQRWLPSEQWQVLLRDRYPAYITWERYERNVSQIKENSARCECRGPIRPGRSLLTGLVVCGRCGARMMTHQSGKSVLPRYSCSSARANSGEAECQSLAARPVDDEVVRLALRALEPSALEVSLQVAADWKKERDEVEAQWQPRLQRADYEADRARRQYDAVESENRLVSRLPLNRLRRPCAGDPPREKTSAPTRS